MLQLHLVLAADYPAVQTWVNNVVDLLKIVAGGVLTVSLLLSIIFIATAFGGERRKAMAITSLIFTVIGGVMFAGLTTLQTIITKIGGQ